MTSIRRQLIFQLLIGLSILFAAASTGLFFYSRDAFISQFDASLEAKILSFMKMSEIENKNGQISIELEFNDFPIPEYQPSPEAEYYQVWFFDGSSRARSPSLAMDDLPRFAEKNEGVVIKDILLPDGRSGRAAGAWFSPAPDIELKQQGYKEDALENELQIVIAGSREKLDDTLITLLVGYIITGIVLIAGIIMIVPWSAIRGLKPLDRIATETAGIETTNLTYRFPIEGLPDELLPISNRLNELLDRLGAAFLRERRFNADIAHELRTPIAELRILAEVSLKRAPDEEYYDVSQKRFKDVVDIARQMEKLVTTLLAIARCESSSKTLELESIDLIELIKRTCLLYQEEGAKRNIAFEIKLPDAAFATSDKTVLSAVLTNLFSNALVHTPNGGSVCCNVDAAGDGFLFKLTNTNNQLVPEDIDHLFEPLWKKDKSRTDSESNGLGLSLVAAYTGILGMKLKAELPKNDLFEITLSIDNPAV